MKIKQTLPRCDVEVEGETLKDCFEQMADAVEVLLAGSRCGACDSDQTFPRVRTSGDYTFYEFFCGGGCGAALQLGQRKHDGALFPKRNDRDGKRLENGGWVKWQPREGNDSPAVKSKADVPF